jgi:hypothetical protein
MVIKAKDESTEKILWLYMKLPDTHGWRLAVNAPLRDIAVAQAMVTLLKSQFDSARGWSVREDGMKSFRVLK